MKNEERNLAKGIIAGAIAGLAAAFVMSKYQEISQNLLGDETVGANADKDPATVEAADLVSREVFDHKLKATEKESAGQAMHYLMGGVSGAIMGATAEYSNLAKAGGGLLSGTAIWAVADDVVIPALGLSKSPTDIKFSTHAYALTSHWVFGTVSEFVRKAIRKML